MPEHGLADPRLTGKDERRGSVLDVVDERGDGTDLRVAPHHPSHARRRILPLRAGRRSLPQTAKKRPPKRPLLTARAPRVGEVL